MNRKKMEDDTGEIRNNLFESFRNDGKFSGFTNFIMKKKAQLKPWTEFMNFKMFTKPKDITQAGQRIVTNLDIYQSNYVAVCFVIVLYCIISSPLLLLALVVSMGACYHISRREAEKKIKVFGRELSKAEQYLAILILSLPIFFLASAGSTIFWIIGASVFVVTIHASVLSLPSTESDTELEEIRPLP